MDLYARVNILGGRAVRLPKGRIDDAISLDADPLARARGWVDKGADRLHIVDLDAAAYHDSRNRPLIHEIISGVEVPVQIAGGVRSQPEAEGLLEAGAWRVVMGTAAIIDQNLTWDLCRDHPGQIAISLDVLPDEELVIRGWKEGSGRYLEECLIEMSSAGAAAFLFAEAGRDALAEPPNFDALRRSLAAIDEPVIAAGGVRNLEDLTALIDIEENGRRLGGVIVGREVTEGRFTMAEAAQLLSGAPPSS
jgi:phosphoribosylformimino-5-aminoimidazole carboxamide ribotide isomerase